MEYKNISDAAYKSAMKSMERDFGGDFAEKGFKESDKAIPTGYDDLDAVLTKSQGGICLGDICEIAGSEGSGKCVTQDTLCLTSNGMMTVEEIFKSNGIACDFINGFVELEVDLCNGEQELETTSHCYKNNYGRGLNTISVETQDGFSIEGTYNHPILVMNDYGFIIWKQLKNFVKGDSVCISRGMRIWNEDSNLSSAEAAFLGYLIGNGTLSCLPKSFAFSNTDSDIVASYMSCLERSLGKEAVLLVKKYKDIDYKLMRTKYAVQLQDKYGLVSCRAAGKVIPSCVLRSSKESQVAFIRAYFDSDGTFQHDKGNLQFSSASIELLKTLQLVLLNFNVYSYITSSIYNEHYERNYYELELSGIEAQNYYQEIGFNRNEKCNKITKTIEERREKKFNTNIDTIPNQISLIRSLYGSIDPDDRNRKICRVFHDLILGKCNLTYARLSRMLDACQHVKASSTLLSHFKKLFENNFVYSKVISIEKSHSRTYDFTLPKTHSFWSNGLISHNTSIAMRAVGMAQRLNLRCGWVDAEGSFSNGLARVNRCDPDELLFLKTVIGKGEQTRLLSAPEVLNKIFKAVWSGVFSLIVVDSVAALIPERVTDTKFDPNSKGISELARDLSAQLPKISAACSEKECTVIFINQLRMKPGERYGDPETTPGGRALKFYASQRISVKRIAGKSGEVIQVDEDGVEDVVGHYARVRVVKNRRHEPCFDPLEIPIYYREYFPDAAKKCYDIARKLQVIVKRKAMLTWKNEDKIIASVEGESAMLAFIRNEILDDVAKALSEKQDGYEIYLAHCCLQAANGERNKSKKIPVKLPKGIEGLALKFNPEEHMVLAGSQKKKKSKKINEMDLGLDAS